MRAQRSVPSHFVRALRQPCLRAARNEGSLEGGELNKLAREVALRAGWGVGGRIGWCQV